MANVEGGSFVQERRFDVLADLWLNRKLAAAGSDRKKLRGHYEARKLITSPNGLGAFFKRTDVGSITTDQVRQYLDFAADHSKKGALKDTTKRNHRCVLNVILTFAAQRGLIVAAPPVPKLRLKDNPRPSFTEAEIAKLYATASDLERKADEDGDLKAKARWVEISDLCMVHDGDVLATR
jgi:hypothetical protein